MKGEVQLEVTSAENPSPSDADPLLENHADSSSPGSSSSIEIRNEDIEAGSNSCCRICLESDAEPGQFFFAYRFDFLFFEFDHNSSFIRNMYNLYLSEQVGFLLKNQELQHRTTNKNRELILCKVPYSIIIIKKKIIPSAQSPIFFFFLGEADSRNRTLDILHWMEFTYYWKKARYLTLFSADFLEFHSLWSELKLPIL